MTTAETSIVEKFHSEILAAESAALRQPIIDSLYQFLGVVEKRIALTAADVKPVAQTTGLMGAYGQLVHEGQAIFQTGLPRVESEAEKIGGEIKAAL